MSLWEPNKMNKLRKEVDSGCPIIFTGNWPTESKKGWRWACNISLTDDSGVEVLKDYQTGHGSANVTIGHPFDENIMKPTPIEKLCGLYVRDVEHFVRELRQALDNERGIEKWLTEK